MSYQPLFEIFFQHQYFADAACKFLSITPSDACREMMRKAGLLVRPSVSGVTVFCQFDHMDRLRDHVADADNALKLGFKICSTDPHFPEYTLPPIRAAQLLFFDSRHASIDAAGRQMLHSSDFVSEQSFLSFDADEVASVLAGPCSPRRPSLIVQMVLTNDADGLCSNSLDPALRRFGVHFAASQSRWKYYLFGPLAEKQVSICDLDGIVTFENSGRVAFPNQRSAIVFQSDSEISMCEIPGQRFQLKENASFGDRILIKRMPNARVGLRYRDVVDGQAILISEIFINY